MKKQLPFLLIWFRLIAGFIILAGSFGDLSWYAPLAVSLVIAGLGSDIFDRILARRFGVSTIKLRRLDSTIDQIFFLCVAAATWYHCPDFFRAHWPWIAVLLGAEALIYIVSYLRFRREVATHSIGAKIWTLTLVATIVELTIHCESNALFFICFWLGLVTRLEILAILLLLREWMADVPGVRQAWRVRKGLPVKRNKLFNG